MKRFLTSEEREALTKEHRQERDKKRADRMKAVLWSDDGLTQEQIAKLLFVHVHTIHEHFTAYKEEKRFDANHKGSKPKLTPEESEILSKHLEEKIYTKIKDIQAYVKLSFCKDLGKSTLHDWLKTHKFSFKKPVLTPKNVDPEAQKEFIKKYEDLMNKTAITGAPVLFVDAVHPTQQTQSSYGWIKRGKDKYIETTAGRKRVNLMGAFNLEKLKITRLDFETINAQSVIQFFKKIEYVYLEAKEIHIILDQAGYHKSKEVQEYLKTSRIRLHFLPPRSPNLNAIERLWKIMHEYVSHNKVYENFKAFKKALWHFFDFILPNIRDVLISRITDNFQVITPSKN